MVMKGEFFVRSVGRVRGKQFSWRAGEVVPRDAAGRVRSVIWVGEKQLGRGTDGGLVMKGAVQGSSKVWVREEQLS